MRRYAIVITGAVLCAAVLTSAEAVSAGPIVLLEKTFAELGGGSPASGLITYDYNYNDTFTGQMVSRAFDMASGDYLYLYQVVNDGPSSMEVFGLAPFFGFQEGGSLTGGEPTGFLADGLEPAGANYDDTLDEPLVTFSYPAYLGDQVPAGEHTRVLYLVSPYASVEGEGYVIDGGVDAGPVVTTLPEPATLGLLAGGAVLMVGLRRKRR
ncbi:MAG: PEP-CTERM sorting domain-containing protein [Phycisphaerae bacterium]